MSHRLACLLLAIVALSPGSAHAQSFGVELFNNLMPASGGMAGASIASPQDVQSAVYGNPSTMTQYRGTQFAFGSPGSNQLTNFPSPNQAYQSWELLRLPMQNRMPKGLHP